MTRFSYHASHEQFSPSQLLRYAKKAEDFGFDGVMCSDHFHPWSEEQGQSGFAWSWLGAALAATRKIRFGVVNAPGQRYHPAIIAQAVATLLEMFPERFWLALGSGQALNEKITGTPWPAKSTRNSRLKESAEIMKRLWEGEKVTHYGLITVEEAKLYTVPEKAPLVLGAALTAKTARWLGDWADGLITVAAPIDELKEIISAFRTGGGKDKPLYLKYELSFADSDKKAEEHAHNEWKSNVFKSEMLSDLRFPTQFEAAAEHVSKEDVLAQVKASSDVSQHIEWLKSYMDLGFEEIVLHNVARTQEEFIQAFGEKVLPGLREESTQSYFTS